MKADRSPIFSAAVRRRPARRYASLLITGGLLLSAGACAMPGRPASTGALTDHPPIDARQKDVSDGAAVTDRNVRHAVVSDPAHHEQLIQPLSHETEQSEAVDDAAGATSADGTAIRYAPEPRVELASYAQPGKPGDPVPTPAECAPYPEEVLCDGGDRALPFHYEGTTHGGLETEDTVAEFRDSDGQRQVRPSSRACV